MCWRIPLSPSTPANNESRRFAHAATSAEIMRSRKERHRDLTQFSRRRKTVLSKADELRRDCRADVYPVIRRESKIYMYTSSQTADWPPSDQQIVSCPSLYPQSCGSLMKHQIQAWPLPSYFGPMELENLRTCQKIRKGAKKQRCSSNSTDSTYAMDKDVCEVSKDGSL